MSSSADVFVARASLLIATLLLLSGCPAPTRAPEAPKPEVVAPAPVPTPAASAKGAAIYEVNSQASTVQILVFRGGALSRLGHNHVISVKGLRGRVWTHASIGKSGFDFAFPVDQLVVDDPDARREAGSDFPPEVSQSDREGTRRNMLRAEVLNADEFPEVSIKSISVSGPSNKPDVVARITIRGVSHDVALKPAISIGNGRLSATGEFDVLQSDFGIKPFTAALGALSVQDRLHVKFNVVADKK